MQPDLHDATAQRVIEAQTDEFWPEPTEPCLPSSKNTPWVGSDNAVTSVLQVTAMHVYVLAVCLVLANHVFARYRAFSDMRKAAQARSKLSEEVANLRRQLYTQQTELARAHDQVLALQTDLGEAQAIIRKQEQELDQMAQEARERETTLNHWFNKRKTPFELAARL